MPPLAWRHHAITPSGVQVFVWQDEDEEEVTQYRTYEGHKGDVLAMAACHARALLATGESATRRSDAL